MKAKRKKSVDIGQKALRKIKKDAYKDEESSSNEYIDRPHRKRCFLCMRCRWEVTVFGAVSLAGRKTSFQLTIEIRKEKYIKRRLRDLHKFGLLRTGLLAYLVEPSRKRTAWDFTLLMQLPKMLDNFVLQRQQANIYTFKTTQEIKILHEEVLLDELDSNSSSSGSSEANSPTWDYNSEPEYEKLDRNAGDCAEIESGFYETENGEEVDEISDNNENSSGTSNSCSDSSESASAIDSDIEEADKDDPDLVTWNTDNHEKDSSLSDLDVSQLINFPDNDSGDSLISSMDHSHFSNWVSENFDLAYNTTATVEEDGTVLLNIAENITLPDAEIIGPILDLESSQSDRVAGNEGRRNIHGRNEDDWDWEYSDSDIDIDNLSFYCNAMNKDELDW